MSHADGGKRLYELKESYLDHVRKHGELTFGVQELLQIAYDLKYRAEQAEARVRELEQEDAENTRIIRALDKRCDKAEAKLVAIDDNYQKIIREVLLCNPQPASEGPDDQLEPPWEVIARLRAKLSTATARLDWYEEGVRKFGLDIEGTTDEDMADYKQWLATEPPPKGE